MSVDPQQSSKSQMLKEAQEAPERVREFLEGDLALYHELGAKLRALRPSVMGTFARGSSDNVATYASYLIPQCTGTVVASLPPSLVTVLESKLNLAKQFVLSISQSGGSPDINGALEHARQQGALTAALVNDVNSSLAKRAEVLLPQRAGAELSLAATKTVLCSMTAVARLAAEWSQDARLQVALRELPETMFEAYNRGTLVDPGYAEGVSSAFVLSRAYGMTAAQEVSLKIKELCGLHSESFSSAEVLHGPREIVNEKFLIIALALPGAGEKNVIDAAHQMKEQGARVVLFGSSTARTEALPFVEVPVTSDLRLAPIAALQLIYPWLERISKSLGRDPDRPRYLKSKVVKTL